MVRRFRPLSQVPPVLWMGFSLLLLSQLAMSLSSQNEREPAFVQLKPPYSQSLYRIASLGATNLSSDLLLIELQLHDNQGGRHHDYRKLDYEVLSRRIMLANNLNPQSPYPAFLLSRVYSQVKDSQKLRTVVSGIERLFEQNPEMNWRRMTEAILIAKHQIGDLPLALRLAEKLAALDKSIKMPHWARDMQLVVLDEMGEKQAAMMLIASLLESGEITDNDERRFLESRLLKIQQELSAK